MTALDPNKLKQMMKQSGITEEEMKKHGIEQELQGKSEDKDFKIKSENIEESQFIDFEDVLKIAQEESDN